MKPLARTEAPTSLLASIDEARRLSGPGELHAGYLERALYGSAREFLARPGKGFRARLIEASYALAGGAGAGVPMQALEAVELLHGGSLVVDDIQDGAQLRRGAPALHRMIGTPLALNTGNWLYFVALARIDELPLDATRARELTRAAHSCLIRCHEGQALDLSVRVGEVRRGDLRSIAHTTSSLKTGALAGFATLLGGTCAGASPGALTTLQAFGIKVGLALQMLDDLGCFVCTARHPKAVEDLLGERVSWVWSWAHEALDELTFKQLLKQLTGGGELESLRERLAQAVEPLARLRIRDALDDAERELTAMRAPSHALEAVRAELATLEKSYG